MKKKLILSLCVFSSTTFARPARFVEGEFIVKFKEGREHSFFQDKNLSGIGIQNARTIKLKYDKLSVLKLSPSLKKRSMNEILKTLRANPNIQYIEPNFIYTINPIKDSSVGLHKKLEASPFGEVFTTAPDDPRFGDLWGMHNTGSNEPNGRAGIEGADINALKAWDITKGSHQVKIAVIDTGIDYTHPDLKGNTWVNEKELNGKPGVDDDANGFVDDIYGYNFADNKADPLDGHGHGTHCAGTIGAVHNNGKGVAGVMNEVTLMPVKFLTDDGSGTLESAVQAIDYATMMNVDIMSNSWGGGGYSQALFDAIKRASDKGIIFTAAAGNESADNDSEPSYPANYQLPNVVSVAALTAQNDLADFSCYGKKSVHIAAPGKNILSTVKGGGYEVMSGTSMATPHVSGVLGLLLAKEGRLSHEVMMDRLTMTGVPVSALKGKTITASRIDAYNLLTDTRPDRTGPDNKKWVLQKLDESFESTHPYKENSNVHRSITVPGAKYIRIKVAKYELESGYDYVRVSDKNGTAIEKISGIGTNYTTDYVEGDTVQLDFVSDRSINKWGYKIDEIEIQ